MLSNGNMVYTKKNMDCKSEGLQCLSSKFDFKVIQNHNLEALLDEPLCLPNPEATCTSSSKHVMSAWYVTDTVIGCGIHREKRRKSLLCGAYSLSVFLRVLFLGN